MVILVCQYMSALKDITDTNELNAIKLSRNRPLFVGIRNYTTTGKWQVSRVRPRTLTHPEHLVPPHGFWVPKYIF